MKSQRRTGMHAPQVTSASGKFISAVRIITRHTPFDGRADGGLLGYLSITMHAGIVLNGVTLRRTRQGRLALSFPTRLDRHGHEHAIVRPIDSAARAALEREVFAMLGIEHEAQP